MRLQTSPIRRSRTKRQTDAWDAARNLAWFRYQLRKFIRFSERAARQCGVTPQHHQLMLGVAGFTGSRSATVSELAEFLQERHNSVVGLIDRAVRRGLVSREQDSTDRRRVLVSLTPRGEEILSKLIQLHQEELKQVQAGFRIRRPTASEIPESRRADSPGRALRAVLSRPAANANARRKSPGK